MPGKYSIRFAVSFLLQNCRGSFEAQKLQTTLLGILYLSLSLSLSLSIKFNFFCTHMAKKPKPRWSTELFPFWTKSGFLSLSFPFSLSLSPSLSLSLSISQILQHLIPFLLQTYSEASFETVQEMIYGINPVSNQKSFLDVGSGVGTVVLQVAAQLELKLVFGIKLMNAPLNTHRYCLS